MNGLIVDYENETQESGVLHLRSKPQMGSKYVSMAEYYLAQNCDFNSMLLKEKQNRTKDYTRN